MEVNDGGAGGEGVRKRHAKGGVDGFGGEAIGNGNGKVWEQLEKSSLPTEKVKHYDADGAFSLSSSRSNQH